MRRTSLNQFVLPLRVAALRRHIGSLLMLLAGALAVSTLVAVLFAELGQAVLFAAMVGGCGGTGWALRRSPALPLPRREALALTAIAYLLFALVGSLAFAPVAGPVDAFFEAMSGFTTTGLTVMDVESLPRSLLFFRGFSQWIGGAGIIVLSLVVLAGPGSAGAQLYAAEFGQQNLLGSVVDTGRVILGWYAALTLLGTAALWVAGAGGFDGLVHGLALASTGGFTPFADSFAAYPAPAVAMAAGVFMVLGAVSLPLFHIARLRGWRRVFEDPQLRALLVLVTVGGAALVAFEGGIGNAGTSLFHATSAVTTTGFSLTPAEQWSDGARLTATGLMAVGGSLGSTAGGMKLLRLLIVLAVVGRALTRIMLPAEAKVPVKVHRAAVSTTEVSHTFALFGAYILLLFVCAVALTGAGFSFEHSVFEVVSGLSTVGLSVGVTSPDLPAWAKLLLAFTMWVGRIEILAALVLLHPGRWQGR